MNTAKEEDVTYEIIDFDELESESGSKKNRKAPDSLAGVTVGFLGYIHFKLLFSIFLIFLLVSSDVFIDKVLGRWNGTVEHKTPTSKGVLIQATLMTLLVMIIDLLLRAGYP
jgi:hypothetical protein